LFYDVSPRIFWTDLVYYIYVGPLARNWTVSRAQIDMEPKNPNHSSSYIVFTLRYTSMYTLSSMAMLFIGLRIECMPLPLKKDVRSSVMTTPQILYIYFVRRTNLRLTSCLFRKHWNFQGPFGYITSILYIDISVNVISNT